MNPRTTLRAVALRAAKSRAADVLLALPDRLVAPLLPPPVRYDPRVIPAPVTAPDTAVRLYIGPANFSGQGYLWARGVEALDDVGAVSVRFGSTTFDHEVDRVVDPRVALMSLHWGKREFEAVASGFTHVIVEAGRAPFGRYLGGSVTRQVRALQERGVAVAMLSHGSDLRSPRANAAREKWSPFTDPRDPWTRNLEQFAALHRRALEELDVPVYVVTPDLLLDWPEATWLPNVVDPARWACPEEPLNDADLAVFHAPSRARIKGTELIEDAIQPMIDSGSIRYERIENVPWATMPARLARCDVVIEQVRLGMYSTAALESMAAGRVVVGHVSTQVRRVVADQYGLDLPIVEATPETLVDVLVDIDARREYYREIARRGVEFVEAVHSGPASTSLLARFLGREYPA